MADQLTCFDDPATIQKNLVCLSALSKNLTGKLTLAKRTPQRCATPQCQTLKVVYRLQIQIDAHKCDREPQWDGRLVSQLVAALADDELGRGVHAGDFIWTCASFTVTGRMSGVTNVGTHRKPAFDDCQRCDETGVMEGRLCGQVTKARDERLLGSQVNAAYRIRFAPKSRDSRIAGTLEGVVIDRCRKPVIIVKRKPTPR